MNLYAVEFYAYIHESQKEHNIDVTFQKVRQIVDTCFKGNDTFFVEDNRVWNLSNEQVEQLQKFVKRYYGNAKHYEKIFLHDRAMTPEEERAVKRWESRKLDEEKEQAEIQRALTYGKNLGINLSLNSPEPGSKAKWEPFLVLRDGENALVATFINAANFFRFIDFCSVVATAVQGEQFDKQMQEEAEKEVNARGEYSMVCMVCGYHYYGDITYFSEIERSPSLPCGHFKENLQSKQLYLSIQNHPDECVCRWCERKHQGEQEAATAKAEELAWFGTPEEPRHVSNVYVRDILCRKHECRVQLWGPEEWQLKGGPFKYWCLECQGEPEMGVVDDFDPFALYCSEHREQQLEGRSSYCPKCGRVPDTMLTREEVENTILL